MKKRVVLMLVIILLLVTGCSDGGETANSSSDIRQTDINESTDDVADMEGDEMTMKLMIGDAEVPVVWEDNESVEALRSLLPLTMQTSMYGGFEQVGVIGQSIPRDDAQISTSAGDIVLYSGNQIVMFYGSNSWAYTRLGHIELSQDKMSALLGNGDVTITISED